MRMSIVVAGLLALGVAPSGLGQVSQQTSIVDPPSEDFSTYLGPRTPGIAYPEIRNRNDVGQLLSDSYPAESMAAKEEGSTVVALCVNAEGQVTKSSIWTSSGYSRLDEAAKSAVFKVKFKPAKVASKPVPFCSISLELDWSRIPSRSPKG